MIDPISRRTLVKSSLLGMIAVSIPQIGFASHIRSVNDPPVVFHRYPSIDDAVVSEIVGASHFNLKRVTELVTNRPELARATWDWSFGDWETALGAASHVGRRDIAVFLMDHGASPDIFTHAMLGHVQVVKSILDSKPDIASLRGPHGISLMQHALAGLRDQSISVVQRKDCESLIAHLETLGTADPTYPDIPMTNQEKEKYIGNYKYGNGETDGVSISLNMRDQLALGKWGKTGGGLSRIEPNRYTYNGTTSIEITFDVVDGNVISLTIHEPDLILTARKVEE